MSLGSIKGLGPKRIKLLEKLNIRNLNDLVFYAPNYYEDRQNVKSLNELVDGEDALVYVRITRREPIKRLKNKMTIIEFTASDGSRVIRINYFNQPWAKNNFEIGEWYYLFGKIKFFKQDITISSPIFGKKQDKELGCVVPVYPLTKDLSNKILRSYIYEAIKSWNDLKLVPKEISDKYGLPSVKTILKMLHFPDNMDEANKALSMMSYIEAFCLQIATSNGEKIFKRNGGQIIKDTEEERDFLRCLPFKLTEGQKSSIVEIKSDLESDVKMSRLLQGDVGSGKTVVAQYAAIKTVASGFQVAFMAPTAILAEQNYKKLKVFGDKFGYRTVLLTSNISKSERDDIVTDLQDGNIDIIVGTHSLLNDEIKFKNIGLVVIDEQHRFGVNQRRTLAQKTEGINLLLMSATPIPRSLALILYGEMDISEIRTMPEGRKVVETYALSTNQIEGAHEFALKEIQKGRQVYYVCPLIEESESMDLMTAQDLYKSLVERFSDLQIALVIGKTPNDEKDDIMSKFYNGKINILVSTTVIEVGIDVPNATCMIIMNAERFGLSQLHQLRGRVGRGDYKSYCLLINGSKSEESYTRIKTMERTSDGFEIATEDLRLRGPGEFLGLRQHGRHKLKFLNFEKDINIIIMAKKDFEYYYEHKDEKEWNEIYNNNTEFIGEYAEELS